MPRLLHGQLPQTPLLALRARESAQGVGQGLHAGMVGGGLTWHVWFFCAERAAEKEHYLLLEMTRTPAPSPRPAPRDVVFLGLQAAAGKAACRDDIYGTLAEKTWRAPLPWLLEELRRAHATLLVS
jgi:hypothetical protein